MHVSIEHRGRRRRARVRIFPTSTAGDLARAVAPDDSEVPAVCIDGRPIAVRHTLLEAGLRAGAAVTIGEAPPADPGPHADAAIVVSGGLAAGDRLPLRRGTLIVGRGLDADVRIDDPTVSVHHAAIGSSAGAWLVRDLGSHNGTLVDGIAASGVPLLPSSAIQLGATALRLDSNPPRDRHHVPATASDGRSTFDRPPRPPAPPTDGPLRAPAEPTRLAGHTAFSWAMFLAPLVVGLVLALVFNPLMGALALLSPVVMVASWFESRRRERRATRDNRQTYDRALRHFLAQIETRRARARDDLYAAHPDPAEVVRRAVGTSARLWERRRASSHALEVRIGLGDVPWEPPVEQPPGSVPHPDLLTALEGCNTIVDAPVVLDLGRQRVVGIAGPSGATEAVARSLVLQAAVHHGPADLAVTLLDDDDDDGEGRAASWMRWLPHWTDASQIGPGRHVLVVVRSVRPLAPGSAARRLHDDLGDEITVVVLGSAPSALPASTSLVVEITDIHGRARITAADGSPTAGAVRLEGVGTRVAEHAARSLARLRDPECDDDGLLPASCRLLDLLELEPPQPEELQRRWSMDDRALAVLGMGAGGTVDIDLERHGPHVLIGGTTGAGKSELLRTMVASLAARSSPDNLTLVLIDFKGGSAFDACAGLPHTVGVVTDLDGRAGERALRSLEAEVRRRERLLRDAGASDRAAYCDDGRAGKTREPLPRLVVVVDEFATLAHELPEVLAGLVDVAQRGRSLGVHLVLATQRPAGVVNDNIRTNTNARIALRVLDPGDSVDLLGEPTAAQLDRHPGRALLRSGQGPSTAMQVAHVSAPASPERMAVDITWLDGDGECDGNGEGGHGDATEGRADPTDLERLVDAAQRAWSGEARPHRPWLEPLPDVLHDTDLAPDDGPWVLGLADDPDHQCRRGCRWEPSEGPLIIAGMPRSGCSTALRAAVIAGAEQSDERHIYVVGTPAEHRDLERCPAVGAVIDVRETERLRSLLDLLDRHAATQPTLRILVAIDGFRDFLEAVDRTSGIAGVDRWLQLLTSSTRRIELVVTTDRLAALPGSLATSTPAKLLLRLSDPYDYAAVGLPPTDSRRFPPGRGLDARTGLEIQIRAPRAVPEWSVRSAGEPDPLVVLPDTVDLGTITSPEVSSDESFAIGLLDRDRQPALVDLSTGLLVVGPDGSGRSTTLATLAAAARGRDTHHLIVTGPPRSRLRVDPTTAVHWVDPADLAEHLNGVGTAPVLCLVDDAELVDDVGALEHLVGSTIAIVVAAAHPDRLRATYGHWTDPLRRSRFGIALTPRTHDGDLWATTLPAHPTSTWPPGRGYLLDHCRTELFQMAAP